MMPSIPCISCCIFCAWLEAEATWQDPRLQRGLLQLTTGTCLAGAEPRALLTRTAACARDLLVHWLLEWAALDEDLKRARGERGTGATPSPAERAVRLQLERLTGEYLLKDLSARGFLPVHGFPTALVPFVTTTLEQLRRQERQAQQEAEEGESSEREDNFTRGRGYPTRDLPMAIREYAPGADVVVDGLVYRSQGVTLNWHIPAHDVDTTREAQAFRYAWRCACGATGDGVVPAVACGLCDRIPESRPYLRPAGFAVNLYARPDNDISQQRYVPVRTPWISAGGAVFCPLPQPDAGRYRYSSQGLIFHYSTGDEEHGYAICLKCGWAASETRGNGPPPAEMNEHSRLRGGRQTTPDGRCPGGEEPNRWYRRFYWLGTSLHTDVFELQLNDFATGTPLSDRVAATSIAGALRQALAETLGIDVRELGFAISRAESAPGLLTWSILLYDTVTGGAGYVSQAAARVVDLLRRAHAILSCGYCDAACHHCLLSFDTQFQVEWLNRQAALALLTDGLLETLELPKELRYFGDESQLEFEPPLQALRRELQRPNAKELRLYLGGDAKLWDPAEWPLRWDVLRWAADGRVVRLFFPRAVLKELPLEVTNHLANLVAAGQLRLHALDGAVADPRVPTLLAEVGGAQESRRWAVMRPESLALGEDWGRHVPAQAGLERCVRGRSAGPLLAPPGVLLESGALRREPPDTLREVAVRAELDGPVGSLGQRLWSQVMARRERVQTYLREGQRVQRIEYSDRYLRSPLLLRLVYEVLAPLRERLAPGAKIEISTAQLDARRQGGQLTMDNDWMKESTRRQVAEALFAGLAASFTLTVGPARAVGHARTLALHFTNGCRWFARLDQGLGFLEPASVTPGHPFQQPPAQQAAQLRQAEFRLRRVGATPSLLYLSDVLDA